MYFVCILESELKSWRSEQLTQILPMLQFGQIKNDSSMACVYDERISYGRIS